MPQVHPANAERDRMPEDPAMHLFEVGLAICAIVAAGILALLR